MTRLNFTGRRRITRDRIRLVVGDRNGVPVLKLAKLDLSGLSLPDSSPVVVEAYRRASYLRIDAGTVGAPALPTDTPLQEFTSATEPLFRIKVVGADDDEGKLLAVADRLRAHLEEEEEGPQASLLPIAPYPLGQRLWKLELTDDAPLIYVNASIGDWKGFASTPEFAAFVLPEVFRQILVWMLAVGNEEEEDPESPRGQWSHFLTNELGMNPRAAVPQDETDRDDWIENVVGQFCSMHSLFDRYDEAKQEGD